MFLTLRARFVHALLVACAAALILLLGFSLLSSQTAQAQAGSSIKLTWSSGVLSLTEQNNGANGGLSFSYSSQQRCTTFIGLFGECVFGVWVTDSWLNIESQTNWAGGSTGSGNYLSYPAGNQARIQVVNGDAAAAVVSRLGIDLGTGATSSIGFNLDQPSYVWAASIKSGGVLNIDKLLLRDQADINVGSIKKTGAGQLQSPQQLQMWGTYGVGDPDNPINTTTSIAEINAYTGSIYVNNTGDLRVGISNTNGISGTNLYPGIQVLAASGPYVVNLGVSGALSLPVVYDGIKAPAGVTITAAAVKTGCMSLGTQPACILAPNGPISITVANSIEIGDYRSARFYGDVTGKGVTLQAGDTITVGYTSYVTSNGGRLNMSAGRAIRVLKLQASGATFFTSGVTPVQIDAPEFVMDSGGTIASSSAPMTITTDSAVISATVRAPSNNLLLQPRTPGRPFDLGLGNTNGAVNLSTAQLAFVDAAGGTVQIGGPNAGPITVTAPITRTGTAKLWLDSPYAVTQAPGTSATSGRITNNALRLSAWPMAISLTNTTAPQAGVNAGLVYLNGQNGPALPGSLIVGDGLTRTHESAFGFKATVVLSQSNQFSTTPALTLYGDGVLKLNGNRQEVGALTSAQVAGSAVLSSMATIDLGPAGGVLTTTHSSNVVYPGLITGAGSLVKTGSGKLTLTNANGGNISLLQGSLIVNGRGTSNITMRDGILGGVGAAGAVTATGGSFQPGLSPGIFTVTNLALSSPAELKLEINGDTPGAQYDQVAVTGGPGADVTLLNPTLTIVPIANLVVGAGYVLIDNQGTEPVNGIFNGLPEGTLVTVGAGALPISYVGCDGNDVVLGKPTCGNAAQPGVGGIVYDAGANTPLVGATVVLTDSANSAQTALSSAGGAYQFAANVAAGVATVAASYPAYAATLLTTTVTDTLAILDLPLRTADLVVSKDDGLTVVDPGQRISYTVAVNNRGALTATGLVITDVVPAYLTAVTDTTGVAPTVVGTYTRTWNLPSATVAPGASYVFTLAASVGVSLPYGANSFTNRVSVSTGSPERDTTNNAASDTNQVTAYPDLNLTLDLTATIPVSQSSLITYVVRGDNAGYAIAQNVTITDPLNTQVLTYTANSGRTINGVFASQTVTQFNPLIFRLPNLAPGDSFVLTFTTRVTNNIPIGTQVITNAATIGSQGVDGNPGDNSATALAPTKDGAFVYLNKFAQPSAAPTRPGDMIEYTLAYGNGGNSFATNAILTDTVPAGTTLVTATPGYTLLPGGVISWSFDSVATDAAGMVTFTVQISSPAAAGVSQIANTAYITAPQDWYTADNSATALVSLSTTPNLVLVKSNGQVTVTPGALVTYTLSYSNTGSGAAAGVVITDTLLANLALESSDPVATANPSAGVYVWSNPPLLAGANTITVVARVGSTATIGALAVNRAVIAGSAAESDLTDNTSTDVDVVAAPFVVLAKSAAGYAYPGGAVTYTIAYRNLGTAPAVSAVISDVLPAGTSFVSNSSGGNQSGGVITWNLGDVGAGSSGVVSFVVNVTGLSGVSVTAPSLASPQGGAGAQITSSVSLIARPGCDFGAACGALLGAVQGYTNPVGPGDWNSNPQLAAFNSTGWQAPMAAITASAWTAPQNLSAQWVAITTTAAADDSYTFYRQAFCVPLNATGLNATGLSASLDQANANVGNLYLNGVYLGQQNGAGAAGNFAAGDALQTGLNVLAGRVRTNAGSRSGLLFRLDTAYAGLSPFAAAPSMVQAGQPVTFTMNPQALSSSRSYSYSVDFGDGSAAAPYQTGASFVHTYAAPGPYLARVTSRSQDGCTGANQLVITVLPAGVALLGNRASVGYAGAGGVSYSGEVGAGMLYAADLSVVKQAAPAAVGAGDRVVYTLVVTSANAPAQNVVLQDSLPNELSYAGASTPSGSCSNAAGLVTCQLGSIGADASAAIVLTATVNQVAGAVVTNTATVAGAGFDPNPANNLAAVQTTINTSADLGITKTSTPPAYSAEGMITYTVVVTNAGPYAVNAITVTDNLPAAMRLVAYTASSGYYDPGSGGWTDIQLAAGGRLTLTISGQVAATQTGSLVNSVVVTTAQANDPNPANNSASVTNERLELHLVKSGWLNPAVVAPPDRADAGDVISYTLVASNTLAVSLTNVTVTDARLGALTCTPAQPITLTTNASMTCMGIYTLTQGDINAGQVDNSALGTAALAITTSGSIPPQPAAVSVAVPQAPSLALVKIGAPDPVNIGERIRYTMVVTNTGNVPLSGLLLVDANLALTKTIATLGISESQVITALSAVVIEGGPSKLTNTVSVTGVTPLGAIYGPVSAAYTVTVFPRADLLLTKSSTPVTIGNGGLLTYSLRVTNTGPALATARAVTVTDFLPAGAAYVTYTASAGVYNDSAGVWTLDALSATKAATLTLVTRVITGSTAASVINVATVTATVADPLTGNNVYTLTTPVLPTGISGRVFDQGTQIPIVDARLLITDSGGHVYSPTTGSSGWYTVTLDPVTPLTAGAVTVTASYRGYAPTTVKGTLAYGSVISAWVPLNSADLLIVKHDDASVVNPGQRITYTIAVTNVGTLTATNVVITDLLPAFMTYVTDTSRMTVTPGAPITAATWTTGSLAPGKGISFQLAAQVTVAVPSGQTYLANLAYVSSDSPDRNSSNNEAADINEMVAYPDLSLSKAVTVPLPVTNSLPVSVNLPITYVLTGGNAGNSLATGVQITDTFIGSLFTDTRGTAQLAVNGVSTSVGSPENPAAGLLVFSLPDLLPGATYVLTYSTAITNDIPINAYIITNTAEIGGDLAENNSYNNSDFALLPTRAGTVLYVTLTPKPAATPPAPGDQILYTLTYGNAGNTSAPGAVITATLPANTYFLTGTAPAVYYALSRTVAYSVGAVSALSTGVLTFSVQISNPVTAGAATLANQAAITTSVSVVPGTEPFLTASAVVPFAAEPDLVIVKSDGVDALDAGALVTYTLTYSNAGSMVATGVLITDTLLTNLTFVTATLPFTQVGNAYVWEIGDLGVDGSHSITVVAQATTTAPFRGLAANRATITTTADVDSDPTNNTSTDTDVLRRPYVVLAKQVSGQPAVGGVLTYTIAYQNLGNGTAVGAVVQDAVPAGAALIAALVNPAAAISPDQRTLTWTLPALPADASGVLTFAVSVTASLGGVSATAPSLSVESLAGASTVTSTVSPAFQVCSTDAACAPFLGVWQGADAVGPAEWNSNPQLPGYSAGGWRTPIAGVPEGYWLPQQQLGAQWVTITDTAQAAANYSFYRQSFCLPLNADGFGYTLQQANDDRGDSYLNGGYVGTASGAGAASIFTGANGMQNGLNLLAVRVLNNNHAAPSDHGGLLFNLQTAYTHTHPFAAAPTMVLVNQAVTFTVDALALGGQRPYSFTVDFGDGSTPQPYAADLNFTHTYTVPGVYTALVTGRDQAGCTGGDQLAVTVQPADSVLLANRATVDYAGATGSTFRGVSGAGILIQPDLALSQRSQPITAVAGLPLTYTLRVTNTGTAAHSVVLTDVLPLATSYVSAAVSAGSCSQAAGVVRCNLGDLVDGQTHAVTVVVAVDPAASGVLTNVASTAGAEPDPVIGNNHAELATAIVRSADLAVTKSSTPLFHVPGYPITYTIVVSSAGPSAVDVITVTDRLPADVTGASFSWNTGDYSSTTGVWSGVNLAAGGRITLTVAGSGPATQTGSLTNTVTVTTSQAQDPDASNNWAEDVNLQTGLVLTKTGVLITSLVAPADIANLGDIISYTITATNTSRVTLTGVSIYDPMMPVSCAVAIPTSLAPGAALTCTGVYTLTLGDLVRLQVANVAMVSSDQTQPVTATQLITMAARAALLLTNSGSPGPVTIGDQVMFIMTVQNGGNQILTDTTLIAAKVGLTQSLGLLNVGATKVVTAVYGPLTAADLPVITNTFRVTATVFPLNGSTLEQTATPPYMMPVSVQPDLVVIQTGSAGPVTIGDTVLFTTTVQNTGNVNVTNVTVHSSGSSPDRVIDKLAVGERAVVTSTYGPVTEANLPGPIASTASVTAITPLGAALGPVTMTYSVPVTIYPGLAIAKTGSAGPVIVGDQVRYTVTVKNTGNVSLRQVTISDPKLNWTQNLGTLAVGATQTTTKLYGPVSASDLPGPLVNTATATAMTPLNAPVGPVTATYAVSVTTPPALWLVKTASPATYNAVDQVIGYTYVVSNSSDASLAGPLTIADDKTANTACPDLNSVGNLDGRLNRGESVTCTGSYTIVALDLDYGYVTNLATASAQGVTSAPSAATVWATGAVAGAVFEDRNGNGVPDPGEPGVAGASVVLLAGDSSVMTATTDSSGLYRFADLVVGGRSLRLTVPAGYGATGATARTVNVAGGRTVTVNFGILAEGSIAGAAFVDLNGSGVHDAGEPGLADVTVNLLANGATVQSAQTDANGLYVFVGVHPGSYVVGAATPSGYVAAVLNEQNVTLGAGAASASFGFQAQGSISGMLYDDRNGNGQVDPGEPGISDAAVTLKDSAGLIISSTTDSAGRYAFTGQTPGVFQVQAAAPDQWVALATTSRSVNLGSGSAAAASFGYQLRGSIGGAVFQDMNGNASQDRNEPGLGVVAVEVLQNGAPVTVTFSAADGSYRIAGLPPGNYLLRVAVPDHLAPVTPRELAVVLADGSAVNANFGLQPVSTIAGSVFADVNGDGVHQSTEPGLGGAGLAIYTAGPDGVFNTGDEVKVAETTSGNDGAYQFLNVPVNAYDVRIATPAGYTATTPARVIVNLAQFWDAAANFGNQQLNTVAATTFEDLNGNGVHDANEPTLAGLPIVAEQTGMRSAEGAPEEATATAAAYTAYTAYTATTGSTGLVVFRDLPAGSYVVRTAPPTSYVAARVLARITVAPDRAASLPFPFQQIGTVAGTIYNDLDGNGRRGAGEPGLGGVAVTLSGAGVGGQAGIVNAVTAVDGSYSLRGQAAGSYQLQAAAPSGFAATGANPVTLSLAAEGSGAAASVSLGFGATNNIGGRVFSDLNRNGVQDAGEPGVSGVAVTISRGAGQYDLTSAVDGAFLAPNVATGVYLATVTLPPNFTATTPTTVTVTVAGTAAAAAIFGVRPNLPNRPPVVDAIADQSYHEGASITIQVAASSPDGSALVYSAAGLPTGLDIDPSSGLISGRTALGSAGAYNITVTVQDALGASTAVSFLLTITGPGMQIYVPFNPSLWLNTEPKPESPAAPDYRIYLPVSAR